MSRPAVSVVIPTFNRGERVDALVRTLLASDDLGAMEVIVVDDGSTDDTAERLAALAGATVVSQPNRGPAAARNHGLEVARAEFVAFTDDDCVPGPGWPLCLLPAFDDPSVAGVGGDVIPAGTTLLDRFVSLERLVAHGRQIEHGLDYLITANAAFRVEVLRSVGGFDPSFPSAAGEDVDLSWRIRAGGGVLTSAPCSVVHHHRSSVIEILATYRRHGSARRLLVERHRALMTERQSPLGELRPRSIAERWKRYRGAGASVAQSAALFALYVAGRTTALVAR